jgi:hypothetical protein
MAPACQEPLALNTSFAGFLLLEQVQSDMPKQSKIFWPMVFAHPTMVFVKSQIQCPVQFILDAQCERTIFNTRLAPVRLAIW